MTIGHDHPRVTGSLQAYGNAGEGDWRGQPAPDGDTRTRFALAGVRWREQASWLGAHVSGGLDVDRIDGSVTYDRVAPAPDGRFDAEAFTLVAPHIAADRVVDLGRGWSLQPSAGVRSYAHSVFDSSWAPHAGLVARGFGMLALRARYARGVNYPGQEVVALAGLIAPLRDSWRTLRPETLQHVETGASFTPSAATSVDVAWFRDRVVDRYVFAFPPAVAAPTFDNLGEYTLRGLEVSVQQRVAARWQVFGALTLLDASIATLPYAPDRTLAAGVTGGFGPVQLAADVQHQSAMHVLAQSRAFGAVNTERVEGFTVVNLRPSWLLPGLSGRADLFLAVENVFDEAYAYRPGYPMPGASAHVGVTWRLRPR
jgi:iron complex outermembrane receptor protein